ncbi:hypothetical protein K4A83_16520 [Spirulina subsalsa FACHB-351]|uniref:Lipoprotein n=1 Tax=Spirulina subsalsa FACHB-351 TaxID=234711 RepID=A0ABT3L8N4_9CYAN|nr:hypothetical protein [Spirulina subsalsa]MCW6037865.1 hypothetical protein [Spirulina subsalsa FACHB-351]
MSLQRGMGAIALLGILVSLGLGSCGNGPSPTGSENGTSGAGVESQILRFNNPFSQSSVIVEEVAEIPLNPETPPEDETPAHQKFTLSRLAPQGDGVVRVYPTESFGAFEFEGEKAILETLLRDHPNLESQETLPYLPQVAASQVFFAQAQYMEFDGGSGIRYITYYAFDVSPIRSDDLFYTFQGLTDDGKYYISAQIPLNTAILPTPPDSTHDSAFEEQYSSYLAEIIARLNQGSGSDFEPNLEQLDEMFGSIKVSE